MKLHWGNSILIFFIIFLSLCAIFIVFSLRQNNDLVSRDYYKKGANYSDQMLINQRSAVYEDSIQVQQQNKDLLISLSPSLVKSTDSLELYFYRPSEKSLDVFLKDEISDTLRIPVSGLYHGRYKLRISWKNNNLPHEVEKIIDIE